MSGISKEWYALHPEKGGHRGVTGPWNDEDARRMREEWGYQMTQSSKEIEKFAMECEGCQKIVL